MQASYQNSFVNGTENSNKILQMPRESAGYYTPLTVNQDATSKLLIKTVFQMAVNSNKIFPNAEGVSDPESKQKDAGHSAGALIHFLGTL